MSNFISRRGQPQPYRMMSVCRWLSEPIVVHMYGMYVIGKRWIVYMCDMISICTYIHTVKLCNMSVCSLPVNKYVYTWVLLVQASGRLSRLELTSILETDFMAARTPTRLGASRTQPRSISLTKTFPLNFITSPSNLARWYRRKRYVNDTGGGC